MSGWKLRTAFGSDGSAPTRSVGFSLCELSNRKAFRLHGWQAYSDKEATEVRIHVLQLQGLFFDRAHGRLRPQIPTDLRGRRRVRLGIRRRRL